MKGVRPLSDFSVDPVRLALLSGLAVVVGVAGGFLAKILLMLIGLVTHIAYGNGFGVGLMQPDPHRMGPIAILVPVAGGLIIGLIARYGTEKIRGHGIPEAIQSILERDSIVQARVAFWKPIASAIAIGSGAPFGAEGPIIMTGGAIGSLFGQYLRVTSLERRTLLVAGAAAGMSATFGAPIASVLIAVELLLFEWRPRSFIPVAIASLVAAGMRSWIIASTPPFIAVATHHVALTALPWAALVGIGGGIVSLVMTKLVYATEDAYAHLPIHWMWWPAIGGLIVGLGGWLVPQALGVGYPTIAAMVNGNLALSVVIGIIVMKIVIWIVSLSSGTSGGVLAPLLMIGAATGTLFAVIIPGHDGAVWATVGMAALMGGTMRAPFMGTIFALETTHAWALGPEVFIGCIAATAFTVVFVPRSILTEKLARRGTHVSREYATHPLEFVAVLDVMQEPLLGEKRPRLSVNEDARMRAVVDLMARSDERVLAVLGADGAWCGTVSLDDVMIAWRKGTRAEESIRRVRRFRSRVK